MKKGILLGLVCLSFSVFAAEAKKEAAMTTPTEKAEMIVVPPQSIDGEIKIEANAVDSSDQDIVAASKNLAKTEKTDIKGEAITASTKETDIPLFKTAGTTKQAEMTSVSRMAVSLGVVLAAAIGLLFFGKWWSKRNKTNEINAQIRVMDTFHLGPKKSLSIVRVAGEFLLLGVTDTNINMIKTLSLIDDEYPETSSQKFGDKLNDLASQEKDEFVLGSIKDVVGKKLKDFRSL